MVEFDRVKRILICRMGAIGDALVALPCFHLINRVFPQAKKMLLTDRVVNQKTVSCYSILRNSGLIDGVITYPVKPLSFKVFLQFIEEVRVFKPDVVINLELPKNAVKVWRDALFFKLCNLPKLTKLVGFRYLPVFSGNRYDNNTGLYEYEGKRLLRYIKNIGEVDLNNSANWNLLITEKEMDSARKLVPDSFKKNNYFVCSLGAKIPVKHWGLENWKMLFQIVSRKYSEFGLMLIGSASETEEHQEIARFWQGPIVNLCGKLTPREVAVVVQNALFFVGHDSGPMHICASQKIPCVAVFSMRALPGVWFPFGENHKVIYHKTKCMGCCCSECVEHDAFCIRSIRVDEVLAALDDILRIASII